MASHPFVIDGHDLRNVPVWMGVTSYLEQTFGAWTVPGGLAAIGAALADRLATREVTVELRHLGAGHRAARRPGGRRTHRGAATSTPMPWCARSTRAGCRRWRGSCTGPCRPSRRSSRTSAWRATCPTCRTRWCCTATRCWWSAPAAPPPTAARRGRSSAAAGSPRTCSARWPGTGSTSARRSSPGSTGPRATSSRPGAAPRSACSGRAARPCATGSARRPRSPVCTPPARTRPPGSGLPFVGLSAALVAEAIGPA